MSAFWPLLSVPHAARRLQAAGGRGRFPGLPVGPALAAVPALNADSASAQATGATFTVNSPVDQGDSRIGDGTCRSFSGQCTLRAAIDESNARPGVDKI